MSRTILHQFLTGATAGDAITDQALLMNHWLRELGFESHVYAWHLHPSMEGQVRPMTTYRRAAGEEWAILRHSIGSDVPDFLIAQGLRLILIFHNVTPPEYFEGIDPLRAHLARLGVRQLAALRPRTGLALADSAYNAAELRRAGFADVAELPISLQLERYDLPDNRELAAGLAAPGPRLLFIGRLAPNKRQEDLVKLLYCLRRIRPGAHLYLVGDRWETGYDAWVERLAVELGLGDAVTLAGKVSQRDMVTYIRAADVYVSMSEHEGFGVPLIESMYLGLPVIAYGVSAVPGTLGGAGVLFLRKEYEHLAELIDVLMEDGGLRRRLVAGQRERVQYFLEPQVRQRFIDFLGKVGLC
jgi:glycosyltransferase involved in cell wall biosynthesis